MSIDKLEDILKKTKPNPIKGLEKVRKITLLEKDNGERVVIARYIKENI